VADQKENSHNPSNTWNESQLSHGLRTLLDWNNHSTAFALFSIWKQSAANRHSVIWSLRSLAFSKCRLSITGQRESRIFGVVTLTESGCHYKPSASFLMQLNSGISLRSASPIDRKWQQISRDEIRCNLLIFSKYSKSHHLVIIVLVQLLTGGCRFESYLRANSFDSVAALHTAPAFRFCIGHIASSLFGSARKPIVGWRCRSFVKCRTECFRQNGLFAASIRMNRQLSNVNKCESAARQRGGENHAGRQPGAKVFHVSRPVQSEDRGELNNFQ